MLFRLFTRQSRSDEDETKAMAGPKSRSNDAELWYVKSAFDGSDESPDATSIRMLKGALGLRG